MLALDPLVLLDAALRGTLLALLLLLSAILGRDRPQLLVVRSGIALCLGLAVQVISATPWIEATVPRLWQAPLVAISVANAVLFWVFVQALFDDDYALRPMHLLAWFAVAALSALNCAVVAGSATIIAPVTMGMQRAIPLVFAILAALAAARNWRTDLVEPRRRLRAFIVIAGSVYTFLLLIARLSSPQGRLAGGTAMADVLVLLLIIAVVTFRMLKLGHLDLFPLPASPLQKQATTPDLPPPVSAAGAGEATLVLALQKLMQDERHYRSEDLTLASLAGKMQIPEYRLRRLINQQLGYRNFNAYINAFRLDEACAALADPAQQDVPVLTIALTSGFQSIGPFNRAFKAATGLTPTEYRKQNMADS
ncbi:transcriptional regulator [Undibacterium sp. YM2]|uniref:helix-turn-helix domain-containing protein n=1 Tax=Undibacterium sp. YM2 TaxID=2058625 RepID=UPI001331DAC3|nr:helix-turn-helix domain-containing protein [Undibacterium sp. YM2]BBB65314.1 transcriptional regulator [Undibacterium sp. YM2]